MAADFQEAERRIEPILAAGRRYDYAQTPAAFYALPEAERTTTNCKDVGHQGLQTLLGIELPRDLQIVEAFADPDSSHPLFRRVAQTESLHVGDWILFGREDKLHPRAFTPRYDKQMNLVNWCAFPINHLGVYLGEYNGERMLLHAAPDIGAEVVAMDKIQRVRRTAVIHEVLRATGI